MGPRTGSVLVRRDKGLGCVVRPSASSYCLKGNASSDEGYRASGFHRRWSADHVRLHGAEGGTYQFGAGRCPSSGFHTPLGNGLPGHWQEIPHHKSLRQRVGCGLLADVAGLTVGLHGQCAECRALRAAQSRSGLAPRLCAQGSVSKGSVTGKKKPARTKTLPRERPFIESVWRSNALS
jgi:hypothetical protein